MYKIHALTGNSENAIDVKEVHLHIRFDCHGEPKK